MFFTIYKYGFKSVCADKISLFWIMLYPIILVTLFNLAFSNILDDENFEKINIAIVENQDIPADLIDVIEKSEMFVTKNTDLNDAKKMLSDGKIEAYINYSDDMSLVVNKTGMNESITKIILDDYMQISKTIKNIITDNPAVLEKGFLENIDFSASHVESIPMGGKTDVTVVFFYSAIAMTCLMGAMLGKDAVTKIQANQSYIAARINVAPTHKLKSFMAILSSYMTFHMLSVLMTLFYTSQVLKVEFGDSMGYILLICLVGSFTGMALGALVSAVIIKKEGIKVASLLTIILLGCFLAGMMNTDIKYIVQDKFPIVSYLNPANLITDGLYTLYYYPDALGRYFLNLELLAIYGVVFCFLTYLILRRQKYASI